MIQSNAGKCFISTLTRGLFLRARKHAPSGAETLTGDDVFAHGHMRKHGVFLEHHASIKARLNRRWCIGNPDFATGRAFLCEEQP